jgi:thiol-disulfide isomerase/thioredoxin
MKNVAVILFLFLAVVSNSQETNKNTLPSIDVKTLDGQVFNTKDITNNGKPIILDFWATWCKPCVKELEAISDLYEEWQEETGVLVVAVSIDNSRSMSRVAPFVNAKSWEYMVLLDPNCKFKEAMNVVNVPHVFLLDGNGNVIHQHTSYADGDEEDLYELVKKVANGEDISE